MSLNSTTSQGAKLRSLSDVQIDSDNLTYARKQLTERPGYQAAVAVMKLKRILDENARALRRSQFRIVR